MKTDQAINTDRAKYSKFVLPEAAYNIYTPPFILLSTFKTSSEMEIVFG